MLGKTFFTETINNRSFFMSCIAFAFVVLSLLFNYFLLQSLVHTQMIARPSRHIKHELYIHKNYTNKQQLTWICLCPKTKVRLPRKINSCSTRHRTILCLFCDIFNRIDRAYSSRPRNTTAIIHL